MLLTRAAAQMGILTGDGCDVLPAGSCCPSSCSPTGVEHSAYRYSGGAQCGDGGTSLCTCNWADQSGGTQDVVYFTADAMVTDSSTAGILRGTTANPLRCRDACAADATCDYATFRWSAGQCYLWKLPQQYHAPAGSCPRRSWWVGTGDTEGGVTFVKNVHAPPGAPPTSPLPSPPPPPPAAPPAQPPSPLTPPLWPPYQPLVTAPEYTWPTQWFGSFACHGRHAASAAHFDGCQLAADGTNPLGLPDVRPQPWVATPGHIVSGYDFGFVAPSTSLGLPSPSHRSWSALPVPPPLVILYRYDWSLPPQYRPSPTGLYTM